MATKIQLRRDTSTQWTANNPTLSAGELGYETDTKRVKIGNGTDSWSTLSYIQIELGTDTSGNYVATLAGTANQISVSGSGSESAAVTISLPQDIATTSSPTFAGATLDAIKVGVTGSNEIDTSSGNLTIDSAGGTVTVDDNLVVSGNLTVSGTTTTVNTEEINLADNIIVLNANATGSPTENAGIEVERGDSINVILRWNESLDTWEATRDGSNYYSLVLAGDDIATSDITNFTEDVQDVVGGMVSSNTESGIAVTYDDSNGKLNFDVSDPTLTFTGDATGSGTITNLGNTSIELTVADNSHNHTASNVSDFAEATQDVVGGMVESNTESGISVTYNDETGKLNFNVNDPTITLSGDVTGSATMTDLGNVTITTTVAADSVALGTDTTGDYVASVSGTDGVSVSGTGESATVTVANTDKGSSQNIFKNVAVSGQSTIVADTNDDTLTVAAGTGITVTTNATTDTLTVTNAGVTSVNGSTGAITNIASTTGKLSQFAATTSAELLGVISDETGTGALVFADSPTLSGTPAAPTANSGTNTTQIATTAFVQTAVSNLVDAAPTTLNTLNELAAALGDDPNFATTVTNSIAGKQPLDADLTAIAGLTGTSGFLKKTAADTWSLDTNTYLTGNQTITLTGDVSGSGTTSISVTVADDSHNHIISNVDGLQTALDAKAPLSSPTFTGTPAAPTAAADTNTTQIATTAYVIGQGYLKSSSYTAADVLTKIKTVDGTTSGLDADLLDGEHGSYYLDWTNVTNKPDPTITLGGDASGSLTLTDLAGGTLTVTVADDSHNHIISNVDGLQTALDAKAPLSSPTFTGTVTAATLDLTTAATATTATSYWVETGSDGIVRPKTLANVRAEIVTNAAVNSAAATTVGTVTSGTWAATDVALAHGGTNASLTAVNGGIVYSTASAMAITSAGTAGQVLTSSGAGAPTWQTPSAGGFDAFLLAGM